MRRNPTTSCTAGAAGRPAANGARQRQRHARREISRARSRRGLRDRGRPYPDQSRRLRRPSDQSGRIPSTPSTDPRGTETLYDKDRQTGSTAWTKRLQDATLATLGTQDRAPQGMRFRRSQIRQRLGVEYSFGADRTFGDNPADAQKGLSNKDAVEEVIARTAATLLGVV